MFAVTMSFFSCNAIPLNAVLLKSISINNQECIVIPEPVNINSNEPTFYPYSIEVNKCSGSCNNINNPYAELCVPDIVKYVNVKVFNLMSRTNETKHIKWYEICKYE